MTSRVPVSPRRTGDMPGGPGEPAASPSRRRLPAPAARLTRLALLLGSLAAVPAHAAQGEAVSLYEALTTMPASLLDGPAPPLAVFVNIQAAIALGRAATTPEGALARMSAGLPLRAIAALQAGDPVRWQQATGMTPGALRYLAGYGKPAAMTTIWGLGSPERVDQLMRSLSTQGFQPFASSGLSRALANGDPLVIDLGRREPGNPWLGTRGQTSIAAPLQTAVVQTGAPQAAAILQHTAPATSLAQHEAIRPALDALQSAVQEGVQVVQAVVVAPATDTDPVAPAARAALRGAPSAMAAQGPQVPAYNGAILADVQSDGIPAVGIALTYDDCATATQAGDTLARAWQSVDPPASVPAADGQPRAEATATVKVSMHPSPAGSCAVLARLGAATAGVANPVFDRMLARLHEQNLPLLRIGNGEAPGVPAAPALPTP